MAQYRRQEYFLNYFSLNWSIVASQEHNRTEAYNNKADKLGTQLEIQETEKEEERELRICFYSYIQHKKHQGTERLRNGKRK